MGTFWSREAFVVHQSRESAYGLKYSIALESENTQQWISIAMTVKSLSTLCNSILVVLEWETWMDLRWVCWTGGTEYLIKYRWNDRWKKFPRESYWASGRVFNLNSINLFVWILEEYFVLLIKLLKFKILLNICKFLLINSKVMA